MTAFFTMIVYCPLEEITPIGRLNALLIWEDVHLAPLPFPSPPPQVQPHTFSTYLITPTGNLQP